MKNFVSIQQALFKAIRNHLPSNISFVHEISELLDISYDSAYRRIRGEKNLTFGELNILSTHYGIALDDFIESTRKKVYFQPFTIHEDEFGLMDWLFLMLKEIQRVQTSKHKEVIYAARDLPVFYYFDFPELLLFKLYFWQKTLFRFRGFQNKLFSFEELPSRYFETGKQLLAAYNCIPTIELWNNETLTAVIRQIEFCWVSGFFTHKEDALIICEAMDKLIHHMQKQVEKGFKFNYGSADEGLEDNYRVYLNDLLMNDNAVLIATDNLKVTFLTYNNLNLLMTTDEYFYDQIKFSLKTLINTAKPISSTSAKERNHFFAALFEKTRLLREIIER